MQKQMPIGRQRVMPLRCSSMSTFAVVSTLLLSYPTNTLVEKIPCSQEHIYLHPEQVHLPNLKVPYKWECYGGYILPPGKNVYQLTNHEHVNLLEALKEGKLKAVLIETATSYEIVSHTEEDDHEDVRECHSDKWKNDPRLEREDDEESAAESDDQNPDDWEQEERDTGKVRVGFWLRNGVCDEEKDMSEAEYRKLRRGFNKENREGVRKSARIGRK